LLHKDFAITNQQNDEIHNSEASITNEEKIENTEEKGDTSPVISGATRSRKKKKSQ